MKSVNTIQRTAKFAGWAYFLIIITSVLSILVGPYKLMAEGEIAKTIENVSANQSLYRVGIVYEVLMYSGVIMLSVALFELLKATGHGKALVALLSRFGEALMGFLTVIGSILILYFINSDSETETVRFYVGMITETKDALMSIIMIFIGIGSVLFFYLFYKSNYIPRWLSIAGMITFFFVFLESLVLMLVPMQAWMFPGMLAIIFEIVVGLWLMIKGVNISNETIES